MVQLGKLFGKLPTDLMDHYKLWDPEFQSHLNGEMRYALDYIGAIEDSRREAEYVRKSREDAKLRAQHPGIEFCETEEEYEDNAQDSRERLAAERAKRQKKA